MPAGSIPHLDRPQQLWLDVARPIQPRPRSLAPRPPSSGRVPSRADLAGQMELRIADPPPKVVAAIPAKAAAPAPPVRVVAPSQSFAAWLLAQDGKRGTIGDLARAARLDPHFPRKGGVGDVRARFRAAGADGEAFAALDDAERAFDRLG